MANRIVLDLGPLRRSREFRVLFSGQLAVLFASQLAMVAIPFQVYALTRSSLQVGTVSLAQLVPLVIGALVGGSIDDAIDRRRLLVVTSGLLGLASAALAVNASLTHPSILVIYLVSAVAAGVGGVASTTATASVSSFVLADQLLAAFATMQVVDQLAMVVAPALTGLLIDAVHLEWVFAAVAISDALAALILSRLSPRPRHPAATRAGISSVVEGLRYLKGRQPLQGAYLIDINAMVFGLPRALFPALAASVFHGGASTLGYLYAAPGAGALLGALTTGWVDRIGRQARAVVIAVCVWGATIVIFGLVDVLWVALGLLVVAGWADVISAVLRTTILQSSVPEAFRSRISSLQIAVVEGGPRLGDLESGTVASLVSTEFSIVSGGLACIVGAVIVASLLPGFRHFSRRRTSTDESSVGRDGPDAPEDRAPR
jgi:MFS family permease